MSRKASVVLLLLLMIPGCLPPPTPAPMAPPSSPSGGPTSPVGVYYVTGTNMDGTPYRGTLTIERLGNTYTFTWETGGAITEGVGLLQGNILSAGWDCGVVTYRIQEDGSLEGVWALCGEGRTGTERAVPQLPGFQG